MALYHGRIDWLRSKANATQGFSLIELLVVICIVALMTVSFLPMFKGTNNRLATEGNAIADLALLAQQNAFGKNTATALVLTQTTDGQQAFALYQFTLPNDGTAPTAANWSQLTPWKFLSTGIAFDFNSSNSASWPAVSPLPTISKVSGKPVQPGTIKTLVFLPNSQLAGALSNIFPNIKLVEGTVNNGQMVYLNQGTPNYYNILINPSTGRAIVERP